VRTLSLAYTKRLSDDVAEVWTPPGPVVVDDDVGGAGIKRSVVSVELTRLVRRPVVVRVTNRRERAVEHALQTNVHRNSAGHIVDHLLFSTAHPVPACSNTSRRDVHVCTRCTSIHLDVMYFWLGCLRGSSRCRIRLYVLYYTVPKRIWAITIWMSCRRSVTSPKTQRILHIKY